MVVCSTQRAVAEGAGAGGTLYLDFVPFDEAEMYKMQGLLFVNGLSPKPSILYWFHGTNRHPLFGNDFVSKAMDKHLGSGRGKIKGKCFADFAMRDFLNANSI